MSKTKLKPLSRDDIRVIEPLYSLREAARYLEIAPATLHLWTKGNRDYSPIVTAWEHVRAGRSIPFIGLAAAFVLKAAIHAGVPRDRIRPGIDSIRERAGGIDHALASKLVWTDGAEILWGVAGHDMEVARTNQRQFTKAVESQLRCITYGDDGFAEYLRLPQYHDFEVTLNPYVAAGKPILRSGVGIRIEDIIDRVSAGDDEEEVARSFRIPLKEVREVVGHARSSSGIH